VTFLPQRTSLKLDYASFQPSADSMGVWTNHYPVPVDLDGRKALRLHVLGDGSGAVLVTQLLDSEGCSRSFFIDVDFVGWRNVTLGTPAARRMYRYPLVMGGSPNSGMRYFRWTAITALALMVTNATAASIQIDEIVAVGEVSITYGAATVATQLGDSESTFAIPAG
jgi:hypothetical protein